jgi:hypothetical protein
MPLRRAAVLGGSAEIFWSGKYFLDLLWRGYDGGRGGSVASMFGSRRLDFGVWEVVFILRRRAWPAGL